MKKIISLVLALALCLTAAAALAEPVQLPEAASSFDMSLVVPEGYTLESSLVDEMSVNSFTPADVSAMPEICILIAYSEEFAEISLTKDMNDEQIKELYALIDDSYMSDAYTVGVTDDGWKFLQVIDNEDENGYATMIMIHDGYFIETFVSYDDFRPMTEDDMAVAKALLDSFVITDVE